MRDDAVLRRALPLGRGLGPFLSNLRVSEFLSNLANRQTDKRAKTFTSSFVVGNNA